MGLDRELVIIGMEVIELDMEGLVVDSGVLIMGLRPPLSISVAPSGMLPPFSVKLVPAPDCGEAVPPDTCDEPVAQLVVEVDEALGVSPPPSNVPLEPVAIPETLQLAPGIGLRPPGSTSVAPSEMPVPLDPADAPGMPRGDVSPNPDVPVALCACAVPQINKNAAMTVNARNISISCASTSSRTSCA